jgi:hypothetical protein
VGAQRLLRHRFSEVPGDKQFNASGGFKGTI